MGFFAILLASFADLPNTDRVENKLAKRDFQYGEFWGEIKNPGIY